MPTKLIYLIGAGGHGKVVLDALLSTDGQAYDVRVRDGAQKLQGQSLLGYPIEVPAIAAEMEGQLLSHRRRQRPGAPEPLRRAARPEARFPCPSFTQGIPRFALCAHVGEGSFLAAQSVVAAAASIGRGVIINHGAVVDHDCAVGDFSHIAPNAAFSGGVIVGSGVLIGAGASILPGVSIGDGAVIGAGAVVTANVNAGETWVGVPARNTARS
jgi:UDP-3-O-[3-hydroxymyristoyl] glucosamine N-acyltransferase